ncbi:MAG TPA: sigma-70 family RNA polymerase sigma factor [Planctomycetota bacterium]
MAPPEPHRPGSFLTTRWSVVLAGARAAPPERRAALEELARSYWYPLYAYARRRGHAPEEAADHTQGFFALLLEREDVARADPARGRFRAYLLTAFRNFLANQRELARARKRGGDRVALVLDAGEAEARLGHEPVERETPERAFERAWVRALLDRTLERLAAEQARIGRVALFERLRPMLTAGDDAPRFAQVAAELALSENAVKVAAHRLRKRFGELLRAEIAETVDDPAEAEEELASLFRAC